MWVTKRARGDQETSQHSLALFFVTNSIGVSLFHFESFTQTSVNGFIVLGRMYFDDIYALCIMLLDNK